jgi:hypothetical protein
MKSNKTDKELLFERMQFVNPDFKIINESKEELMSDEGQIFIKKIRQQNPELELRFRNIILNKGLNIAIDKYNEFDPEYIKQQKQKEIEQNKQNLLANKTITSFDNLVNKLDNKFKNTVLSREKKMGLDGAFYFTLGEYMQKFGFKYELDDLNNEQQDSLMQLIITKFPELEF